MKIILLQDVPKVGRKYEIKEVADGFGRNVLLAQKKGVVATPAEIARINKLKADKEAGSVQKLNQLKTLIEEINHLGLVLKMKGNNDGQLFAAIHESDLVRAVAEKFNYKLEMKDLKLPTVVKSAGQFTAQLKTSSSHSSNSFLDFNFTVEVIK